MENRGCRSRMAPLSSQPYQYNHLGVWPLHSQYQYPSEMRRVDTGADQSRKRTGGYRSNHFNVVLFLPFSVYLFLCNRNKRKTEALKVTFPEVVTLVCPV